MTLAIITPICNRGLGTGIVEEYLQRVRAHRDTKDAELYLVVMDFKEEELEPMFEKYRVTGVLWNDERLPLATNRRRALSVFAPKTDLILFQDDDIFMGDRTSYSEMMTKCMDPFVGCISLNWRKTAAACDAVALVDSFIEQPIVNIGGGMMFRRVLVDTVIPDETPWMFDDAQYALNAYLAGLTNYRYLGGIAEHRVMMKGGLVQSFRRKVIEYKMPDENYVKVKRSKVGGDDDYQATLMFGSSDLTTIAKKTHASRKKILERVYWGKRQ